MNLETLTVKLTTDLSGLKAGMSQATAQISGLTENVKQSTSKIGKQFSNVGKSIFNELKKTFKALTTAIALTAFANEIRKVMVATDGWKDKVQGVKDKWNELIQNMSELLMPLIERMIPVIEKVLSYLNSVASKIGNYFGIKLSSSLKKTQTQAEKVKATIASFDDLNVLSNNNESTSFISEDVEALEDVYDTFESSGFAKQFKEAFANVKDALDKVDWNQIKELAKVLGELALNVLVTALNGIAGAIELLYPVIQPLIDIIKSFVESINEWFNKNKSEKQSSIQNMTDTEWNETYDNYEGIVGDAKTRADLKEKRDKALAEGKDNKALRYQYLMESQMDMIKTNQMAQAIVDAGYYSQLSVADMNVVRQGLQGGRMSENATKMLEQIYKELITLNETTENKKTYAYIVEQAVADATYNYDSKYGKMVGSIRGVR